MAKFIYTTGLAKFKEKFPNWNQSTDDTFRSIAFCEDGYIVTHGKEFRSPLGTVENPYGLAVSTSGGTLTVTIGDYDAKANVLIGGTSGTYTTATVTDGNVKFDHKTVTEANITTNLTTGGTSTTNDVSSEATIVGGITYDTYGHVHSTYNRKLILNQVAGNIAATNTNYYILGHALSSTSTAQAYKNSNIYFNGDTLYVGNLYVNNKSITDLISASQALYFKGTVETGGSSLPTTGVSVGDLYVVGTKGYTVGTEVCEAGDMIIATSTTPTWAVVQRNLVNALTEANLGGTDSGNTRYVKKSSNGLLYVSQTDTNTWRPISVGTTTLNDNSTILSFAASTGIGLGFSNGKITITNSSPLSNAIGLTFKYGNAGSNNVEMLTYNPSSTAKSVTFKAGNNVSLAYDSTNAILTINSSYVNNNTTYSLLACGTGGTANAVTTNGNTYLRLKSSGTDHSQINIKGSGSTTVTSDANGVVTVSSTNTWRNVSAYFLSNNTFGEILSTTIGTRDLAFGSDFVWTSTIDNNDGEIRLSWAEVADDGTITYTV